MSLFETFFILQGRRPNEGNFSDAFLQTIPSNGNGPPPGTPLSGEPTRRMRY